MMNSSRLIVKNIPKYTTEMELKERFSKFGKVTDVRILYRGNTHRRFCFIGFKDTASAQQSKDYFNNTYIDTCKITVDFASTLNDDTILEQRKKKLNQAERAKPGDPKKKLLTQMKVESRQDKLSRIAQQLGLDPSIVLTKRPNPSEADNQNTENPENKVSEVKPSAEGEVAVQDGAKPVKKVKGATVAPVIAKNESLDSKRLYVYNFPFSITKEELRAVFEPYGKVSECIIPMTPDNKSKGFGYVSFEDENCAIRAIAELDNQIAFGRILHIKPSEKSRRSNFEEEKKQAKVEEEKPKPAEASSFKKLKREEFLKNLNDDSSWNSLFLNPNTVMEYVAQEFGLSKLDLLNREVDNPAVKISLAETKIINETKEWFRENGVNLRVFDTTRKTCPRSRTAVMIKNLPKDCTKARLAELLNRYGFVNRILMPPNKAIAIAQFRNIDHASNAFSKLSESQSFSTWL